MPAVAAADISRAHAARELLARREARHDYRAFRRYVMPGFIDARHNRILADTLTRVESGELTRVMVFWPPRHGKSTDVSQLFPCWFLGRNPRRQVVLTGYAESIALDQSRKARDIFTSEEFHALFPEARHRPKTPGQRPVPVERQAAGEWGTVDGGNCYAVGVGGGLTGRGMDLGIIDDPVKDWEEAQSKNVRDKVWDWYQSTFYTRLSPRGAIVILMTRWHQDDLAGRLLRQMRDGEGDNWHVVHMPAVSDDGEALFPERFNTERLEQIKRAMGTRKFSALYQGNPTPEGGAIFLRNWYTGQNRYDASTPAVHNSCVSRVQSWDTAAEVTENAAYSACVTGELSPDYRAHITDVWKDKLNFPALCDAVIRRAEHANADGKLDRVLIEYKSSGVQLVQYLQLNGPEWLRPLVFPVPARASKAERGIAASVWCENGSVLLPDPCAAVPWLADFEDRLYGFPAVAEKDEIDAFAHLVWYWTPTLAAGAGITVTDTEPYEPNERDLYRVGGI